MSVERIYIVLCDYGTDDSPERECDAVIGVVGEDWYAEREASREAVNRGWSEVGRSHFCPMHGEES